LRGFDAPPETTSPFNAERLPAPHIPSGLGLTLPLPKRLGPLWLFALIPAVVYSLPLLAIAFPVSQLFIAGLTTSALLIVIARYVLGVHDFRIFLALGLTPIACFIGGSMVLDTLHDRPQLARSALVVMTIATLVMTALVAAFYRGYLLADESVPPVPAPTPTRRPIVAPLIATVQTAIVAFDLYYGPVVAKPDSRWYGTTDLVLALLAVNLLALGLTALLRESNVPNPASILRAFLTYGARDPGAGGVWRHSIDRHMRLVLFGAFIALVSFAVPVSLQWFRGSDQQLVLERRTNAGEAELKIADSLEEQTTLIASGWTARPMNDEEASAYFGRRSDASTFATAVIDQAAFRKQLGAQQPPPTTRIGPPIVPSALDSYMSAVFAPLDFLMKLLFGVPLLIASGVWNVFAIAPVLLVAFTPIALDAWIAQLRSSSSSRSAWENVTDRLALSTTTAIDPLGQRVRESDHIFIGQENQFGAPVLLHRALLNEHCYIVGDSGSGKTSLGIMPMLIQLIRSPGTADPIIILDLKGDSALFNTAREEAELRGRDFRFFTLEKGQASHYFNPFLQYEREFRTDIQVCQLLLDSLSLNHGEGYGRGYYSKRNRRLLLDAIEHPSKPQTFRELYDVITELAKGEDIKEAFELVATVHALTKYPQLESHHDPEQTIHFPTALEKGQVVYFWLPAAIESVSAREIAKLALFGILSAAIDRQRLNPSAPRGPYYVFIDEFQRLAGENFKIILEQARSFGIAAILANQSISDLKTPDTDLRPTVQTNTRVKFFFSIQDAAEARALSDISGEEVVHRRGWSRSRDLTSFLQVGPRQMTESVSEATKPRLSISDIRRASDHPNQFAFFVSRGSGLSQFGGLPIVVSGGWPMSFESYRRRRDTPWPRRGPKPALKEIPKEWIEQGERFAAEEEAREKKPWRQALRKLGVMAPRAPEPTLEEGRALTAKLKEQTDGLTAKLMADPRNSRETRARFLPEPEAVSYAAVAVSEVEPKTIDAEADRTARQRRAALIQQIIEEKRQRETHGPQPG
jgi:hypothetical protein